MNHGSERIACIYFNIYNFLKFDVKCILHYNKTHKTSKISFNIKNNTTIQGVKNHKNN